MTNRGREIEDALIALASAAQEHRNQTSQIAASAESRALNTLAHGWDGVSQGNESAAEQLTQTAGELEALCNRVNGCIEILRPIHDDTSLGAVTERLSTAVGELDTALDGILVHLDEARAHLAGAGEDDLTGILHHLIEQVQESTEALADVRKDIDEEIAAASTPAGGSGKAWGRTHPVGTITAIQTRIAELRREGHAPQRHGAQVTDQQLTDRALWGIDPMTGTTTDGATGSTHKYGRDATKFTTDEALVEAEKFLRSSEDYKAQERDGAITGDPRIQVAIPLQQVLGPDYLRHVQGIRRSGSKAKPTGDPPGVQQPTATDFTDGTLFALYRKDADGEFKLITMFPRPRE